MKLKTKLIPLTSLSLISTTTIPLCLTGCGNSTAMNHSFNLVDLYRPTIERYNQGDNRLSNWKANEVYMEQLDRNLDTFVQDYMWSKSWSGLSFEQFLFWQLLITDIEQSHNIDFDDPNTDPELEKVDRVVVGPSQDWYETDVEIIQDLEYTPDSVVWNNEEWRVAMLSFTLKFQSYVQPVIVSDAETREKQVSGYVDGEIAGEISFYNVPFYVRNRTIWSQYSELVTQVISVEPFYEWMTGDSSISKPAPDWKIRTLIKSNISGELVYVSGTTERVANDWTLNVESDKNNPSWKYGVLSLEENIGCLFCSSFYLEHVQIN